MISFVTVDNVSAVNDITDFELHEIAKKKKPAKKTVFRLFSRC
jgi:hypothetical protein